MYISSCDYEPFKPQQTSNNSQQTIKVKSHIPKCMWHAGIILISAELETHNRKCYFQEDVKEQLVQSFSCGLRKCPNLLKKHTKSQISIVTLHNIYIYISYLFIAYIVTTVIM